MEAQAAREPGRPQRGALKLAAGLPPPPADFTGHGTAVAGIIGAVGNNGVGTVGVNWQVRRAAAARRLAQPKAAYRPLLCVPTTYRGSPSLPFAPPSACS
jgi:subtilisin family serine protease